METHLEAPHLRKNGIGLIGAATLGVVMLSPAMTLYGGFGPAYLTAGDAAPLAFVIALLATLPTAYSYIMLSRDHPISGSAASWADLAFSKKISIWTGWMVFLYYLTNFIIQPVTLGVFAGDLAKLASVTPGFLTYAVGAVICLAWGAGFVYRGIVISSKSALTLLLIETAVVTVLCITVVVIASSAGTVSFHGFSPAASPTGMSGVFRAMVFGILAYCGFDVVSTLAEETKDPKVTIPRATFLSLFVYAGLIVSGIWALTHGSTAEHLKKIADAGQMPITEVANQAWGKGGVLIPITGISATLGLTIATAIGASRVLFAMARSGLAPRTFSAMNASQSPHRSLHVIFASGLVCAIATGAFLGAYDAYVWWGTTSTFFAMVTYLMVNASNLVLNGGRAKKSAMNAFSYFLVPVSGILIDAYLLYRTFFVELWAQGWATGQSVVVFDCVCCAIAAVVALKSARKRN